MISLILGIIVFTIGILNLFLVHPVPGIVFLLVSLMYLPVANTILKKRFGFSIPGGIKIALGIAIIWFTLGISDLGNILDNFAAS